ncbi:MAG: glycosyltransferase family 4 protein [Ignavibacteriaceae bacterium]
MKILQISPQVPLPLDDGGRKGIYGITKGLADRGNEIYFVCYSKNTDNTSAEKELSTFCRPYIIDVNTKNNFGGVLLNLFSKVPYNISKFKKFELQRFVEKFLKNEQVDIVHVDHLHLGWIVDVIRNISNVPIVLREHNLEMKIMERFYEKQRNPIIKLYAKLQYKKFIKYEPTLAEKFDRCIMITSKDEQRLKELNPKVKTSMIGAGVDKELLDIKKKNILPYSIFHIGSLEWLPNYDGLMWYLEEIFPTIVAYQPKVKFFIYGIGAEKLRIPASLQNNIIKVGYVKDLWNEILDKQLAVVPLRIGGGIRVKIIEMLGIGQNIISTSIGKEGIDADNKKHLLIADSAKDFINKTIAYFNNEYDSAQFSLNAKQLIKEKYTWEKIAEQFENEYSSLLKN